MTDAITLDALTRRYGDCAVVDQVSFSVPAGGIFGFMGHNGAGKTTTLRMMLGLLAPSSGRASVLGLDPQHQGLEIRRRTGFLPASYALPPAMTPRSLLAYLGAMSDMAPRRVADRTEALLTAMGLLDVVDRPLRTLSTGMAQKVGLAQALLHEPELLLLDEPTSGLDPLGRHDLLTALAELAAGGVTVLFSSHILSDVEAVCSRVAVLHQGRLIAAGALDALKAQHGVVTTDALYLALARAQGAE